MGDNWNVPGSGDQETWSDTEVLYGPEVPLAVRLEHEHELMHGS